MQADYRKELSRNFMILNCHFDESAENYQLRTLLTNRIRGLMPFALEHVDNQQKCRYEITGFVSFATCCESFELSLEDLKKYTAAFLIFWAGWRIICLIRTIFCLSRNFSTLTGRPKS